ncbi:MAG: biopolymer transporter ExbD [Steroidobacteraceae bacterium]|jgi:biopolymer transport protein ExbD
MSMSVPGEGGEEEAISTINTTPLVDVMLVLLIIFLITVPVITKTIPLELPNAANIPTETKPENITVAIDKEGKIFWNLVEMPSSEALLEEAKKVSVLTPQPEVHIRADKEVRYEYVGRAIVLVQRAGILKVGFITEPPARGTARR